MVIKMKLILASTSSYKSNLLNQTKLKHKCMESNFDENVTVIKRKYKSGGEEGTIAIIGPKRMEYERVVSLLNYMVDKIEGKDGK